MLLRAIRMRSIIGGVFSLNFHAKTNDERYSILEEFSNASSSNTAFNVSINANKILTLTKAFDTFS